MNGNDQAYGALLQRAMLLRQQRRYKEAGEFLGKAIELDPEKAGAYAELALCLIHGNGHTREAMRAIDRALALEPTSAPFFAIKGWVLIRQRKFRPALKIAHRALEMDPLSTTALNLQANVYTKLRQWKQAEETARRILALHARDTAALNLLAQALRFRGKSQESREVVLQLLALLPNNAFGHMNAGYSAMEVGDHLRANEHFLTSLRMDPHFDAARQGLLHSLRARVWLYRLHFRYLSFIRQPATFLRVVGLVFVLVGIVAIGPFLNWLHHGLGGVVGTLAFGTMFYLNWFSRITGDLFLYFDPVGRHALNRRNKTMAGLFAPVLLLALVFCAFEDMWLLFALIGSLVAIIGFSIHYPQLKDRWQMRMH